MTYKVPEGWEEVKLGDIATLNSSNYKKSDGWRFVNYLDTGNITNNIIEDISFIDLETAKLPSRARRKVFKDDIIYSTVRPIQKHLGIIEEPLENMLVSTGFTVITPDKCKAEPYYIYLYLTQDSLTNYLQSIAEQRVSTYPALNISDLETLDIILPPLQEQKAIANTLSAIDDKIELNNKINQNLEAQAQAIFKSWFIDFEPFQDGEFVESELGMIPKGWEIKSLDDIVDIKYGKNLPTKELLSIGYPVFGGNGVIGYYNEYLYENAEVIIACRGAASGKVNISYPKSFITNNSLVLESPNRLIFEYIKGRFLYEDLKEYVTGSAQPQLTISNIKNVKVLLPERKLLKEYYDISANISSIILNNNNQNQKLAELRDTLLPKLISGEIRIPLDK